MKGDFSRYTFDPRKHYIAVLTQQGRVQVDADLNEQQAINQYRIETEAKDVIGLCGVPETVGGFEIGVLNAENKLDLKISPGRIYVDGLLCELEEMPCVVATELVIATELEPNSVKVSDWKVDGQAFEKHQWIEIFGKDLPSVQVLIVGVEPVAQILRFEGQLPDSYPEEFNQANDRRVRRITTYTSQPDYPNPDFTLLPDDTNPPRLDLEFKQTYLVYLHVWQRHITALDDSRIREVALGVPDTTTRLKTIWQVKLLSITFDPEPSLRFLKELKEKLPSIIELEVNFEFANLIRSIQQQIDDFLKKFPNGRAGLPRQEVQNVLGELRAGLKGLELEDLIASIDIELARIRVTCYAQFPEWEQLIAPSTGTLNARTQTSRSDDNPCLLPPTAGYQRLENQLYRIEIHQGGAVGEATFKWSRDNGSIVTAIEKISGQKITVQHVGPDDIFGFANGQWVEIIDDRLELNGQPGQLIQITGVDASTREITLQTAPSSFPEGIFLVSNASGIEKTLHPKLRRWDSKDAIPVSTDTNRWIPLEGGIEVQFASGTYKTGNYWLIPARTATGEIEWPPYQVPNPNPIPQPPLGTQHRYCRLATLEFVSNEEKWRAGEDCRKLFPPLTGLAAIHVIETSWKNDDLLSIEQLVQNGLTITLDAPPMQEEHGVKTISAATMIVVVEIPFYDAHRVDPSLVPDVSYILDGDITVTYNRIHWQWSRNKADRLGLNELLVEIRSPLLVRVTLKGHVIWSDVANKRIYLDGQTFGQPGMRAGSTAPCTDLIFPSGAGARASDFESWFYLTPTPLQITKVRFIDQFEGTVRDIGELPTQQNVEFQESQNVNTIEITFSRAVKTEGLGTDDTPPSLRVEQIGVSADTRVRVPGNITIVSDNVVRFIITRESSRFSAGSYRLIVSGNDELDFPAFRAADNNAALDGDFSGQAGGNLELSFGVIFDGPR